MNSQPINSVGMMMPATHSEARRWAWLLLIVLSAAGMALVLLSTQRFGVGLSPDSVNYISSARNLKAGAGLVTYRGLPLSDQPLLYPASLALGSTLLGADPLTAARWVNAVLFGLTVFLSGLLFFRYTCSAVLAVSGAAFALLGPPIEQVAVMAWSELLFICLTVAFLWSLDRYLSRPRSASFALICALAGLAALTRYPGVAVLATGFVSLLCLQPGATFLRLRRASLFLVFSAIPLGVWLARVYLLTGTLSGARYPPAYGLSHNAGLLVKGVLAWFSTDGIGPAWLMTALSGLLVLVLIIALFLWGRRHRPEEGKMRASALGRRAGPAVLFVTIYSLLLVSLASVVSQEIDTRLLAPLYIPMIALALVLATLVLYTPVNDPLHLATSGLLALLMVIRLGSMLVNTMQTTRSHWELGAGGFSQERWRLSETIRAARETLSQPGEPVYSNAADALYILGDVHAEPSPRMTGHWLNPREQSDLQSSWPSSSSAYLVWFDGLTRSAFWPPERLADIAVLSKCVAYSDGRICHVTSKP